MSSLYTIGHTRCFNEAAAIKPRKEKINRRRDSAGSGFNEAAAIKPRKVITVEIIMPSSKCFNEAAAIKPRKEHQTSNNERQMSASMRPQLLSRGKPLRG